MKLPLFPWVFLTLAIPISTVANITMAPLFLDHAVHQRDWSLPILDHAAAAKRVDARSSLPLLATMTVPSAEFHLPVWFDLGATFAFALTGALAAIRRGYDIVGVFFLALATGLGGGLIRDGVFISMNGPTSLLTDPRYIEVVAAATIVGAAFGRYIKRFGRVVALIDALGLGAYAAFGTQKALQAGLAVSAAILVGVINAAGGGLLRDILTREEPLVFRPGQFYVLTAFAGAVTFVFFSVQLEFAATAAAIVATTVTFVFRALTILFNWRTSAVAPPKEQYLTP